MTQIVVPFDRLDSSLPIDTLVERIQACVPNTSVFYFKHHVLMPLPTLSHCDCPTCSTLHVQKYTHVKCYVIRFGWNYTDEQLKSVGALLEELGLTTAKVRP